MIRIKIIEAKNLPSKDALIRKNKSDPFCAVQVGAQMFKTKTIKNTLNPKFSECFEAIVNDGSCQTLQIEIFDEDKAGFDEELGHFSFPLNVVKEKGTIQQWSRLEGSKSGEIHYKIQWYEFSKNKELLGHQTWDSEWRRANNPIYSSLVMVYIDHIQGLPEETSKGVLPSSYIECSVGTRTQRSLVYENATDLELHTTFSFFIEKSESQVLNLSAIDDGTQNLLGKLEIPLADVVCEPKMELYQVKKYLRHESFKSSVVLTVRVRAFEPCKNWNINEKEEVTSVETGKF
uniref:C2 domain-containing protein n=1 Tax=Panagrolaimus davidi TaxID=227884 RepID=A0A914QVK6_9BILA